MRLKLKHSSDDICMSLRKLYLQLKNLLSNSDHLASIFVCFMVGKMMLMKITQIVSGKMRIV